MDLVMNEEEAIKLSLDSEIKRLKEEADEIKKNLKHYTSGLKAMLKEKYETSEAYFSDKILALSTDEKLKETFKLAVEEESKKVFAPILGLKIEGKYLINGHCYERNYQGNEASFSDKIRSMIEIAIRESVREELNKINIKEIVSNSLNGMTAEHAELVNFSKNLAKALKEELGEGIGDISGSKIIESISWEMKRMQDKKRNLS